MYYAYFIKIPYMSLKRVIMILAASFEFYKRLNAEIIERHTDSEEVYSVSTQIILLYSFLTFSVINYLLLIRI